MSKKRLNLLVTASTFPRYKEDTEPRFVLDLCNELKNYFDITVLVPACNEGLEEEDMYGIKVKRYHYFPIHKFETLCYPGAIVPRIKEKKIRALLVPFLFISLYWHLFCMLPKYDLVHAHWLIPQGIVQGFFKKPYLVTGHGGDVTSLNKGFVRGLKIRTLKKAAYVTVVSKHLLNEVRNLYPVNNIKVISMGCNTEKFDKEFKIENYFQQGNKKVILFAGRLAEKKGVTYIIKAMHKIDAILVIVGDGPLKEELMHQASQLKEKVVFLGAKTHDELKTIYASSDIFVAPSVTAKDGDQEGFGLVILEAMASGLPVVASRSGGITDLIIHHENGLLTEEKDIDGIIENVNLLINDHKIYKRLSVCAIDTAKKYDYKNIAKQYVEIINSIN